MSQTKPVMLLSGGMAKRHVEGAPPKPHEDTARIVEANLRERGLLQIVDRVASRWRVDRAKLLGRDRHKRVSAARRELWALLYGSFQPISYPEFGYIVGRDHSTIMSALEKREREVLAGSAA